MFQGAFSSEWCGIQRKAGRRLADGKGRMDGVTVETVAPAAGQISLWHLVMLGLALASIWGWAIIIEKFFAVRKMNAANDRFEQSFWSGQSLEDL